MVAPRWRQSRRVPAGPSPRRGSSSSQWLNLAWSLAGFIAEPSFSTAADAPTERVLGVDFNGWHAFSGLLLFAPAFFFALRPAWAVFYALYAGTALVLTSIWIALSTEPLFVLTLPNNETDAVFHLRHGARLPRRRGSPIHAGSLAGVGSAHCVAAVEGRPGIKEEDGVSARTKGLVVAICAGLLLALPASAMAVFPGVNDRILFVSGIGQNANDDGDADLFVNQLGDTTFSEGEALAPLLTGQRRHPNWSPNGNKIVFSLRTDMNNADLYIHNVAQGSSVNITNTNGVFEDRPAWSPDGVNIAYERLSGGQWDVMVFNTTQPVSGTNPRNLTASGNFGEGKPVWSPDGKDIYYSKGTTPTSNTEDIFKELANNTQGVPTPILTGADLDYQPALSPDGTKLCFTRGAFGSNDADVKTVNSDGGGTVVDVSDNEGGTGDYNCAWSPDGARIAFVQGTFTSGYLVHTASNDSDTPSLLVDDTAGHFDGNPDYARVPQNCDGKSANVIGTDNDDTLSGFAFKDVIQALDGNDTANGKAGKDRPAARPATTTSRAGRTTTR